MIILVHPRNQLCHTGIVWCIGIQLIKDIKPQNIIIIHKHIQNFKIILYVKLPFHILLVSPAVRVEEVRFIIYSFICFTKYNPLNLVKSLTIEFSFKMSPVNKCLSFALVVALSVNVVGEFFLRFFINLIVGMDASKAMLTSYTKLPAALLTSIVTILGIALLFYPVYYATEKLNGLNDLAPYLPRRKKKEEGEE